jgi:branched-chain amino acid transport system substrate-binding protein
MMKKQILIKIFCVIAVSSLITGATSPGVSAEETIKIGMITDLTGMAYLIAKDNVDGATLAVEQINSKGGVAGKKLELLVRDSALKTDAALAAARELIMDQNVNFIFGPVSSAVRLAVSDMSKQMKIPMIDTIGGSRRLIEERGHDYFFELSLTTRTEAYGQAVGVSKLKGKKLVSILPDYEWGRMEHENFMTPLKKLRPDMEIVGEFWPKLGEKDFTSYITAIIAKNPDIIWNGCWGGDFMALVKQAKPYGIFEKFDFVALGELATLSALGDEAPAGIYCWDRAPFYAIDTPEMKAFVEAYKARYGGKYPSSWSILGYEGPLTVKYGLEKAGTASPEAWVKAMKGATVPLLRGPITFREADNMSNSPVYWGKLAKDSRFPFLILKNVVRIGVEDSMISVEELKKLRAAAK